MFKVSDKVFENIVGEGIDAIPAKYQKRLDNVAFIVEDEPTESQRVKLGLACDQTLLGLYEGVPLPARGGTAKLLPDKITIFKKPMETATNTMVELKDQVAKTIWHEVAHYYGLDHSRIHKLEK